MRHQHQQPTRVAILGANMLVDRILARLLKDEYGDLFSKGGSEAAAGRG